MTKRMPAEYAIPFAMEDILLAAMDEETIEDVYYIVSWSNEEQDFSFHGFFSKKDITKKMIEISNYLYKHNGGILELFATNYFDYKRLVKTEIFV